MMRAKAQIFTWDLVFSMMLFGVVITAVFYMWHSTITSITAGEDSYDMGWIASLISEQLVRLSGVPQDWNQGNVVVVGLASHESVVGFDEVADRLLDPKKFFFFVNMTNKNYASMKATLLRASKYDFYINFSCRTEKDGDPLHCFKNLPVKDVTGVVYCENGFSIIARDGVTSVAPLDGSQKDCIVGHFRPLSEIDYVSSNVKNAVFAEVVDVNSPDFDRFKSLEKPLAITFVIYRELNV